MKSFIDKFSNQISGVISCFDRMVFKGYLPLGCHRAMEACLFGQGVLIKDFKRFVATNSERVRLHAQMFAQRLGRPFEYVDNSIRKEDLARQIAQRDGVTQGLVCILHAVEPCQSSKVVPGPHRPQLVNAQRK